jgi:hypothetical protein
MLWTIRWICTAGYHAIEKLLMRTPLNSRPLNKIYRMSQLVVNTGSIFDSEAIYLETYAGIVDLP